MNANSPVVLLLCLLCACGADFDPGASSSSAGATTSPPDGSRATSNGCGGASEDLTWSGSVTVDCDVLVLGTLTIAAGTVVRVGAGHTIEVEGSLLAQGTAEAPVRFEGASAAPWGPLWLSPGSASSVLSLRYVVFTGGGEAQSAETADSMGATLILGNDLAPVLVDHVTVEGSTGVAVVLRDGFFAPGSSALTIHGAGSFPLFVKARAMGSVPAGQYTGNARDGVLVESAWQEKFSVHTRLSADTVIRNLGVPWIIGAGVSTTALFVTAASSSKPTLVEIEPGAQLRFSRVRTAGEDASYFQVDQSGGAPLGIVRALGTAAQPITFSSAESSPQPGDWVSVRLGVVHAETQFDHVVVEYAGANSGVLTGCDPDLPGLAAYDCDAAFQVVYPAGEGGPTRLMLTNSTIRASLGAGVCRDFEGEPMNLRTSNAIEASCAQTPVRLTSGCQLACE